MKTQTKILAVATLFIFEFGLITPKYAWAQMGPGVGAQPGTAIPSGAGVTSPSGAGVVNPSGAGTTNPSGAGVPVGSLPTYNTTPSSIGSLPGTGATAQPSGAANTNDIRGVVPATASPSTMGTQMYNTNNIPVQNSNNFNGTPASGVNNANGGFPAPTTPTQTAPVNNNINNGNSIQNSGGPFTY